MLPLLVKYHKNYPCLCLCLGFEHKMYTLLERRTTLHLAHLSFNEDLIFIVFFTATSIVICKSKNRGHPASLFYDLLIVLLLFLVLCPLLVSRLRSRAPRTRRVSNSLCFDRKKLRSNTFSVDKLAWEREVRTCLTSSFVNTPTRVLGFNLARNNKMDALLRCMPFRLVSACLMDWLEGNKTPSNLNREEVDTIAPLRLAMRRSLLKYRGPKIP